MPEALRWNGGTRLRDEIERWYGGIGGIESFVTALQERDPNTPGANRAMVQRYLGGRATPSIDFLHAAADVLDIPFEWLALGTGPRAVEEPKSTLAVPPRGMEVLAEFGDGLKEVVRRGAPEITRASDATQLLFVETFCRYLLTYSDVWEELGFAAAVEQGDFSNDETSPVRWEIVEDFAHHLYDLLTFKRARILSGKPFRTLEDFERQLTLTAAAFVGWLPPIGAGRSIAEDADLLFDRVTPKREVFYEKVGMAKRSDWETILQQKDLRIRGRVNSRRNWRDRADGDLAADTAEREKANRKVRREP